MEWEARPPGVRFLQNLSYLVTTYVGYKDPSRRRNEDARFRCTLLNRIEAISGLLEGLNRDESEEVRWRTSDPLTGILSMITRIATSIRNRPTGAAGFFSNRFLEDPVLDAILEIDLVLFEDLDRIEEAFHRVTQELPPPPEPQSLDALRAAIERFEHRLIERDGLLAGVRVA